MIYVFFLCSSFGGSAAADTSGNLFRESICCWSPAPSFTHLHPILKQSLFLHRSSTVCEWHSAWKQGSDKHKVHLRHNNQLLLHFFLSFFFFFSFHERLWWDSPFVASQLDKIGPVKAKLLAAQGFDTVTKLKGASSHHFEIILNGKPPMGTNVMAMKQEHKSKRKSVVH
jgi:hypothetical protein